MKIYRAIFAVTIVAFNIANFQGVFGAIGAYLRYPCLFVLSFATLAYAFKKGIRVPPALLASFYLFASYAFVTAFWTENSKLTIIKWLIYVSLSTALFIGGVIVAESERGNPFWPLKYVFVPVVLVSAYALLRGGGWFAGNFRGLAGNSNALGATLMLTSPWLIYELRQSQANTRYRMALVGLAAAGGLIIFLTFSRASLAGLLIIVTFAGSKVNLGRKFVIGYVIVLMLLGVYIFRPTTYRIFYSDVVEKRSESVLKSRSEQLQDSWEAAKKGGFFGAGFGVSIGSSKYWEMGRFSNFSREKGNSMLAVVEELGILGFLLYLLLLYAIFSSIRKYSWIQGDQNKFLIMLSMGFLFAAVFHSAFEAWFLSSGPDVTVFWSTVGLFIGTLILHSRQANGRFARVEAKAGAGVFVPAPTPRR